MAIVLEAGAIEFMAQLEDEELVSELERQRGKGRDDYPVRAMWNAVVFFPLTGHTTWKSYVRELERNRDLLAVCGFPVGCKAPAEWVMSRFLKKVKGLRVLVDDIIHRAIDVLGELLPDYCEHLGIDSQAFNSSAQKRWVFVPTPRHTIKFERGYRRRTAVERINGLFNELFGIKRMKVRGLPSARLRVSMMVMTVLTMAVARIHNDQKEKMTSIVAAA